MNRIVQGRGYHLIADDLGDTGDAWLTTDAGAGTADAERWANAEQLMDEAVKAA